MEDSGKLILGNLIKLTRSSEKKFKLGNFKGALEDKRQARRIRLLEKDQCFDLKNNVIDYKSILIESCEINSLDSKHKVLLLISKIYRRKYDLIEDYKKVINDKKKNREEYLRSCSFLIEGNTKIIIIPNKIKTKCLKKNW